MSDERKIKDLLYPRWMEIVGRVVVTILGILALVSQILPLVPLLHH